MKLYYGSKTNIKNPIYGMGNPSNDYGLGFYLTDDIKMAELWASQYVEGGYVISYSLDINKLNILKLYGSTELDILKWITVLVKHRFSYQNRLEYKEIIDWLIKHFDVQIDQYDMVVGYRADDSYFNYSLGFIRGDISLETLASAMKLGRLGLQYVLISKTSFSQINFIDSYQVNYDNKYTEFRKKVLNEYHELLANEDRFNNTFIGELMKKYGK